jgi:UDP-N-acetylmuramoyl-tripeptide--D-alanyl-D-alanine ligase
MKSLLRILFRFLARRTIAKYRPTVIAVAGSVGKTATKDAVAAAVASAHGGARKTQGSFNAEIGVPVTIIAGGKARSGFGWGKLLIQAIAQLVMTRRYPKVIVLEMGADKPGDLRSLLEIVTPHVGILTSTAPEHMEFFGDMKAVIDEESLIVRMLPKDGVAIVNIDDERSAGIVDQLTTRVITYGWNEAATVRAEHATTTYNDHGLPSGMVVKVAIEGSVIPVAVPGVIGRHQVLPILASIAAASAIGMPISDAIRNVSAYQPPPGRMRLLPGKNNSVILDDSYNASPEAVEAAVRTLTELHVPGRKIAILGQMSELGAMTNEWHEKIGQMFVPKSVSVLVTVGPIAHMIGTTAVSVGFPVTKHIQVADAESS